MKGFDKVKNGFRRQPLRTVMGVLGALSDFWEAIRGFGVKKLVVQKPCFQCIKKKLR